MGILMIRCPKTGLTMSTGWQVEAAVFRASPVFFSRTYCSHCRTVHEWFAKDAWVWTTQASNANRRTSGGPPEAQGYAAGIERNGVAHAPVTPVSSFTPVKNRPTTARSTVMRSKSAPRMSCME